MFEEVVLYLVGVVYNLGLFFVCFICLFSNFLIVSCGLCFLSFVCLYVLFWKDVVKDIDSIWFWGEVV